MARRDVTAAMLKRCWIAGEEIQEAEVGRLDGRGAHVLFIYDGDEQGATADVRCYLDAKLLQRGMEDWRGCIERGDDGVSVVELKVDLGGGGTGCPETLTCQVTAAEEA